MQLRDLSTGDNPALQQVIAARIREAGPIGFDEFMRMALYHPAHGYYVCCDPTLDYQSSPNVHPVFGATIARQVIDFWRLLDRPPLFEVFEAGAGNLRLAHDMLRAISVEEPNLYDALSHTVQDETLTLDNASRRIESAGLPLDKVSTASALPDGSVIEGCILSNELLDALPVHRVRQQDGSLYELRVGLEGERFVDVQVEAPADVLAYFDALGLRPGEGSVAEVNLDAPIWITRAANALRRGYMLTLDYGYEASEMYVSWRKRGTLLTFYRHTSGDDPYIHVGQQDITASVDFTTVRRAGESAGLRTYGTTTQSELLANLGAGDLLGQPPAPDEIEAYYGLRRAVIELTDASGLGRIRALIQGKGTPDTQPRGLATPGR